MRAGPVSHEGVTSCWLSLAWLARVGLPSAPMTRWFQVGDATLGANDPQLGPALADAHARRIRPFCLCREPGAPLYVARVAGQFIAKRMPGTGGQHDPGCEAYEAPPELSGFGDLVGRAIQEDADAGVTVLRLGFSLSRTGGRPGPSPVTREADSVKADASKLSLKATLHYRWEDAGFNRWSERMTGKRNWFIIRKPLLQAAENKITKGTSSHFGFLGCGGVGWLGWGRLRRCSAGRARWRPREGQGFQELGPGGEHTIGAQGLQVVEEAGSGSKRLAGVPPSA